MDIERVKRIIDKNFKPFIVSKNSQMRQNDPEYHFVNMVWWSIKKKHAKKTTNRIVHNMTLEELSARWAQYEIEREV